MKYFRCSLIAVILLLFAGGAVYWVRQHKTVPTYDGKPLTYWLKELENTSDYKKRQQAETALRQADTNALSELIYILESNDPWLKTKSYAVVNRVFSKKYSYVTYTQRCAGVSRAFGLLGDQARPAIPDLIRLLQSDDPAIANAAIQCLFHVSLKSLNADDIPLLLPCLTHRKARTRAYAATFLGRITQNEKEVVPALIKTLSDPEDQVKQYAANALGYFGPRAKAAASALCDLCHDNQLEVRIAAAKALVEIEASPEIALVTLIEALKSSLLEWRQNEVISAIEKLGPHTRNAAELLGQFIGDTDNTLAKAVQAALQRMRMPLTIINKTSLVRADFSAGSIKFLNASLYMVFDIYRAVTETILDVDPNISLYQDITMENRKPMTRQELIEFMEQEISLQAHVIFTPGRSNYIKITRKPKIGP